MSQGKVRALVKKYVTFVLVHNVRSIYVVIVSVLLSQV